MKGKRYMKSCFIISLVLLLTMMFLLGSLTTVFAADESEISDTYMVGDQVTVPEKTLVVDGEKIKATILIEEPSGSLLKIQNNTFVIREDGKHTITYKAISSNGVVIEEKVEFLACAPLYQTETSLSKVNFGTHFYGDYEIKREAILASIASVDKFVYNEIIDLRELDGESFLEFFVTPETIGTCDATKIEIVLTDIYNSDNFVTIAVKKGVAGQAGAAWAEKTTYVTGNAPGQQPTGLEKNKGTLVIDGVSYLLHNADVFGANIPFSLPGHPNYVSLENPKDLPEYVGNQTLSFSMDIENKAIYANGQLVTLLADEDIYNHNLWDGFTTGECTLTISATGYNASSLNLAITKLGAYSIGNDTLEETEKLKNNVFVDSVSPTITITNEEEYSNGYPNGIVGYSYKIFEAEAFDDYTSNVDVYAHVFYRYGTDKQVSVDVVHGQFTPYTEGIYTIVYYAEDRYGNIGKLEVNIDINASNDTSLSATIPTLTQGKIGQEYTLPVPEISYAMGNVDWRAEAKNKTTGIIYYINSNNPTFLPEYYGEYEVTYYVEDYVKTVVINRDLFVAGNDHAVLFEDPILPQYFIYGCEYYLPSIMCKEYSTGAPIECIPEIYVIEDGGSPIRSDYRFITYASTSVKIIYKVTNNGQVTQFVSDEIPVVDVGYNGTYSIKDYFVTNSLNTASYGKYIHFAVDKNFGDNVSATFINPLQTFDFTIKLASVGYGMEKINIYLQDYANPNVVLKFTYRCYAGQVFFSINDGEEIVATGVKFNDENSPITLMLNNNGKNAMPTGTSTLTINTETDLAGNKFNGFTNSMAYLTFELEGITNYKQAGVYLYNISGQPISGIYLDTIKPQISAIPFSGARPFGTEFTIPGVYVADVLDPNVKVIMTVTAPDGSYVKAKDGTVLNERNAKYYNDYTIVFDQFGSYTISYTVVDISGNKLPYSFVLTSSDMTSPDVTIKEHATSGKAGEKITVAEIDIFDNKDKNVEDFVIYAFVTTPQGQTFGLVDKYGKNINAFTAYNPGIYTVGYMVMDSSGNLTLVSYEINIQ